MLAFTRFAEQIALATADFMVVKLNELEFGSYLLNDHRSPELAKSCFTVALVEVTVLSS